MLTDTYRIPYISNDEGKPYSGEIVIDLKNIKYLRSIRSGDLTRYYLFLSETNLGVELTEEDYITLKSKFNPIDL